MLWRLFSIIGPRAVQSYLDRPKPSYSTFWLWVLCAVALVVYCAVMIMHDNLGWSYLTCAEVIGGLVLFIVVRGLWVNRWLWMPAKQEPLPPFAERHKQDHD